MDIIIPALILLIVYFLLVKVLPFIIGKIFYLLGMFFASEGALSDIANIIVFVVRILLTVAVIGFIVYLIRINM